MKTNKIIASALVVLGFGSVLGLGSGCAHRASKSRKPVPAQDGAVSSDPAADTMLFRVMYGVPPVPYKIEQLPEGVSGNTETPVQ